MRIDGHSSHLVPPGRRGLGEPVVDVVCLPASHDVEQDPSLHIDEARRIEGVAVLVSAEHLVLVDPQGPDALDALWVFDQGRAVTTHAAHGGLPADPEAPRRRGHRVPFLAVNADRNLERLTG